MRKCLVLLFIATVVIIFTAFVETSDDPVPIPSSKQRIGNKDKGFDYLVTGDYVKSGVPYSFFIKGIGSKKDTLLVRKGLNATLPYPYTAITAKNGEILVAPNCLQCHAQVFDHQLVIGLGNTLIDFTQNPTLNSKNYELLGKFLKATNPKQYEAAAPFLEVTKTIAPFLYTNVRGVNSADRLAAILAAHRDPASFTWSQEENLAIPAEVIPTDTPPWWLMKKKNAMFYNGFGRGDFGRFLMASNLLTVHDTMESRQVDEHMPDVLAYIYSLSPPKYPKEINIQLAGKGRIIFEKNCSSCHGHYGKKDNYPNLLIPETVIQTDSFLIKSNYSNPQFINWFNKSWFTKGDHPARLETFNGYIAPPLDGIWITAPYLHNGSVPTLEALLDSKKRPRYWSRDFNHAEYNYEKVGLTFNEEEKPNAHKDYNTDLPGYGNYGHYFGDALTDTERKAIIEYLKTL